MYPNISIPNWTLAAIAVYTIRKHLGNMYDPLPFMKAFQITTEGTARTVAFLLVLINCYDLVGALQDNTAVFWWSVVARLTGATFFWSCGNPWDKLIAIELKTTTMLLGALFLARVLGSGMKGG